MSRSKLCAGIGMAVVVTSALAVTGVGPASADPAFTPGSADIVGVGSDTIEFVMQDLANQYNAGAPAARLVSWNATGPAGESWSPRAGVAPGTYQRPNGSGAGKKALYGVTEIPSVNYARSSAALDATESSNSLQSFPFAVDGLELAVSGDVPSRAPASISAADIVKIYNGTYKHWNEVPGGTSTAAIHPFIPQSGSGTRKFFESQLTAIRGGAAWSSSDYGAAAGDYPGVQETQEHDPTSIHGDASAVAPFSTARAHTLANPASIRLEKGWEAKRAVYNVVRGSDTGSSWVASLFGPSGYLCSTAGRSVIEQDGFAQLASGANGGVCGQVTQAAVTNFTTNTVSTTTALNGVSDAAGSATLTATLTSGDQVADGEVDFFEGATQVGSALLSANRATATVSGLTPGAHSFTARFASGNPAAFTDSVSPAADVLVKAASVSTLTLTPARTTYGHARSAVVTVTGAGAPADGAVSVKVGTLTLPARTLTNGQAVVALPTNLAARTWSVTATYLGTAGNATSSASRSLVVGRSSARASESFASTALHGRRARGVVRVALSPSSRLRPTGTVYVKKGTRVIARGVLRSGAAVITLPALKRGTNRLSVYYGGSTNVARATRVFTITQR